MVVLAGGLSACGSSGKKADAGGLDGGDAGGSSDARADTGADVRVDVKADTGVDVRPIEVSNPLCQGTAPTNDYNDPYVIADFDNQTDLTFGALNSNGSVAPGGTYTSSPGYPAADFAGQNWHLTAAIGPADDAHVGIYWQCSLPAASGGCTLDVSRFKGIRFKVSGNAGPDHQMYFSLGRAENDVPPVNAGCGSCVVPAGNDASPSDYCLGPHLDFPVPADGSTSTVTLLWTDFTGGSPHASIDPHQITGILWRFHPYPIATSADGGTDADASDASDAAVSDAPLDAPSDAAVSTPDADISEAGSDDASTDASTGPSYAGDITIDDIELVPF